MQEKQRENKGEKQRENKGEKQIENKKKTGKAKR